MKTRLLFTPRGQVIRTRRGRFDLRFPVLGIAAILLLHALGSLLDQVDAEELQAAEATRSAGYRAGLEAGRQEILAALENGVACVRRVEGRP